MSPALPALSPIEVWPPDYEAVYRTRVKRLERIRKDPELLRAALVYYADAPVDFIRDWLVTYDPRRKPAYLPFLLFDRQVEFIDWLHERNTLRQDGVCEKSRDMGITWLCMAYALHQWLFVPGVNIGFSSFKEEKLDTIGNPDSIFEKGRIALRNLPREFLPPGFDVDAQASFKKFVNPANGSSIVGEAGSQIGRGGRATMYIKDESAFYEQPQRIEAALSQTSDCKIDVSTSNGVGIPFHNKITGGQYPVFRFHWRDDPRKDDAWYAEQKRKMEPADLAREVDIDHTASVEGICIPAAWVQAAKDLPLPAGPLGVGGLDVGGGGDKSVFIARFGPVVSVPVEWGEGDTTATAYRAWDLVREQRCRWLNFDSVGIGAGVASTLKLAKAAAKGVNTGEKASNDLWSDGKRAHEKFQNRKAELWWKMRDRFRKTFEHVTGAQTHPLDELISVPRHPLLLMQLSQPKVERMPSGKLKIESKKDLKARGIPSTDFADALALTFDEQGAGVPSSATTLSPRREAGGTIMRPTGSGAVHPRRRGEAGHAKRKREKHWE